MHPGFIIRYDGNRIAIDFVGGKKHIPCSAEMPFTNEPETVLETVIDWLDKRIEDSEVLS
jgi:hypothetical protein